MGEELLVTGTRLRRKDLTTPAPVTVIDRSQLASSGHTSLGAFLQTLPEQGNAFNEGVNNGGDGATRLSLRSLGAQRTLVLLNGRRMTPGGLGADATVDLDLLPLSAVERIEVLKDGASAVYGSDAIAGVVNVITRRRMEGLELSASGGTTTHGDGQTYQVGAAYGASGEAGRGFLSVEWHRREGVRAADRAFSRGPVAFDQSGLNNPFGQPAGEYRLGSDVVPAGTFAIDPAAAGQQRPNPGGDPRIDLYNQVVSAFPQATRFIRDPSSPLGWRPFVPAALPPAGDAYDWASPNLLVTPRERVSLLATGELRLSDTSRAYGEAMFARRTSRQVLDAEPLSLGTVVPLGLSAESPANPFGVELAGVDRRLLELGPRTFAQEVNAYRLVLGVDGAFPTAGALAGWSWDVSGSFGRTTGTQTSTGSLRLQALADAVGPGFVDPVLGPRCGTPASPVPGCVPLALLGGAGALTPAMLSNLAFTGVDHGSNQLVTLQASAAGELFRLAAARPVGLAVGYELRRLSGSHEPDPLTLAGQTTGLQVGATSGAYTVNEAYAELAVPLVSQRLLVEQLEATAAARAFTYSNFGAGWTWKLGARWSPLPDVTLRGTWSTAFRAPSIAELYLGEQDTFVSLSDPCAAADAPASCGASAGNGDDRVQLRSRIGGNPALQPERARTRTLGLVLEPRSTPGFTVTVDYWAIDVDEAIGSVGEATILASCYPTDGSAAPRYCDLVERDPATGRVVSLRNLQQNSGHEHASGVDLALRWALPSLPVGRFTIGAEATWLRAHDLTLPDGTLVRGRGNYDLSIQGLGGVQGVNPAWKLGAAAGWARGPLAASVDVRVIGSFSECGDGAGDYSGAGLCFVDPTWRRQVDAWSSFGAQVAYTLASGAGRTTFAAGVQNAFDAEPPRIYNGFYAASDPTAYDYAGRFVYLRLGHAL